MAASFPPPHARDQPPVVSLCIVLVATPLTFLCESDVMGRLPPAIASVYVLLRLVDTESFAIVDPPNTQQFEFGRLLGERLSHSRFHG